MYEKETKHKHTHTHTQIPENKTSFESVNLNI